MKTERPSDLLAFVIVFGLLFGAVCSEDDPENKGKLMFK